LRSSRKLVVVAAALSAIAVSLVLVAIGNAGSDSGVVTVHESPINLTTGQQGLAWAKFTPSSSGSNGSATHVQISITINGAAPGSLKVATCPGGTGTTDGAITATCSIASLQSGTTAKVFVLFTAASSATYPLGGSVSSHVTWDAGGSNASGGAGQFTDSPTPNPTFTVYSDKTATNVFAGACINGNLPTQTANNPGNGKGGNLSSNIPVDPTLGFPCTPGYVGIDNKQVGTFTPGVWRVFIEQLTSNGFAQVVLTLNQVPKGTNAKTMPLYELDANDANPTQVQNCDPTTGLPPGGGDSCLTGQAKFGSQGVQFFLKVQGTADDPGYAG
jgi:hypothetical protein